MSENTDHGRCSKAMPSSFHRDADAADERGIVLADEDHATTLRIGRDTVTGGGTAARGALPLLDS
jgi:hypothetical protein